MIDDDHSHHICWAATCVLWWLINPIFARKRRPHVGQEIEAVPSGGFWLRSFLAWRFNLAACCLFASQTAAYISILYLLNYIFLIHAILIYIYLIEI